MTKTATKTAPKHASKATHGSKATHASTTHAKRRPAGAHKARRAHAPSAARGAHLISYDIRSLAAEVKDLRTLRSKYDQLLTEHHGLLGALRELSSELAGSARAAWQDYRGGKQRPALGAPRQRIRAASSDVDAMTAKLVAALPAAWSTKDQICAAAGLDPKVANSAFRRLVLGYKRDGKRVAPALESNGKRGTEGRDRKR